MLKGRNSVSCWKLPHTSATDVSGTIAMDMSEGLVRGMAAKATGAPIKVPVGEEVLGRIFNVVGDPIDGGEAVKGSDQWSIHL